MSYYVDDDVSDKGNNKSLSPSTVLVGVAIQMLKVLPNFDIKEMLIVPDSNMPTTTTRTTTTRPSVNKRKRTAIMIKKMFCTSNNPGSCESVE